MSPNVTLSTTNPTRPDLGSSSGRGGATNRLSYGTTVTEFLIFSVKYKIISCLLTWKHSQLIVISFILKRVLFVPVIGKLYHRLKEDMNFTFIKSILYSSYSLLPISYLATKAPSVISQKMFCSNVYSPKRITTAMLLHDNWRLHWLIILISMYLFVTRCQQWLLALITAIQ
jgi:hypothetical protein